MNERTYRLLATAVVLLAFGLRVYHIGTQEVWLDEAAALHWATAPDWLAQTLGNNTPPLYYVLLRLWTAVAGESQAALRLPSALCGTLFVAAIIWVGRSLCTPAIGLWSGLCAAVSPIHIYYSQEARTYALLMLLVLLTFGAVWQALQRDTWRSWVLVAACAVSALYSHYLAILGLAPTVVLVRRARARAYVLTMGLSLALFVPWAVASFVLTPHSLQGTEWVKDFWARTPPSLAIPRSLEVFGLGSQAGLLPLGLKQLSMEFPVALRALGLLILALLGVCAAVPWGDDLVAVSRRRKLALWTFLVLPLALLWTVSFWKPVYIPGRYDLVAYPAYPLLLGFAFGKLQRWPRVGSLIASCAALALLIPTGAKLLLYYYPAPKNDTHPTAIATAAALDTRVPNGGLVVFTDLRGLPVLYQLNRLGYRWADGSCENAIVGRRFGCRMFPRETEATPAVYDPRRVLGDPGAVHDDVRDMLRPSVSEVYVVLGNYAVTRDRLAVATVESLLIAEIERLGFRATGTDLALGMMQYRRGAAQEPSRR